MNTKPIPSSINSDVTLKVFWLSLKRYLFIIITVFLLLAGVGKVFAVSCPPEEGDGAELNGDVDHDGVNDWSFPKLTQKDKAGNKTEVFCLNDSNEHGCMFGSRYTDGSTGESYWVGACVFDGGKNERSKEKYKDGPKKGQWKKIDWFNYEPPPFGDDDWHFLFDPNTKQLKITKTQGSYSLIKEGGKYHLVYEYTEDTNETGPAPQDFNDLKFEGQSITSPCPYCGGLSEGNILVRSIWLEPGQWDFVFSIPSFGGTGYDANDPIIGTVAHVAPGDTLTIEGKWIVDAEVQGHAAEPNYGAWMVQGVSPNEVTFEATVDAYLMPAAVIGYFHIESGFQERGYVQWDSTGEDICYAGYVEGPGQIYDCPGILEGDLNVDCIVDFKDVKLMVDEWLEEDDLVADIEPDGITNLLDYALLACNWLEEQPSWLYETLDLGLNLFESSGVAYLDIPADFFFPGSEPFTGEVVLQGIPLETGGAFELGTTDAVIERLSRTAMLPPPSKQEVFVELVELSLLSIEPITVMVDFEPQEWDVSVLLESVGPGNEGTMTFNRTGEDEGTIDFYLPVRPIFVFTRCGDVRTLELEPIELVGTDGLWMPMETSPANELMVPHLPFSHAIAVDLTSPILALALVPPHEDPNRPGPQIEPGAEVDPEVASLGRYAIISSGAYVGAGAVIGPYAFIGPNAVISDSALVGEGTVISDRAWVGSNAIVDDGTMLESDASVLPNAVIGSDCNIGPYAHIGMWTYIGSNCILGQDVFIGNWVNGGESLNIGYGATISGGLELADNAQVDPYVSLYESLLPCSVPSSGVSIRTISECQSCGGAIMGTIPGFDNALFEPDTAKSVVPIDDSNLPPGLSELGKAVNDANVAPGGGGKPYVKDTHDCEDFADELERALEAAGYDATFTVVYPINTSRKCWQFWKPKLLTGHCYTDVRDGDGVIWIEAQWTAPAALSPDPDLDYDNDGKVEYATGPGTAATEANGDKRRIEVYESMADCPRDLD